MQSDRLAWTRSRAVSPMLNKPDTVVQTHKSQMKKLNLEAPYDTAIPFVNIHLKEWKPDSKVWHYSWLSTCLHLELTKTQAAGHTCEDFYCLGYLRWKTHPKSGSHLLGAAHIKGHGRRKLLLSACCPHSHWQGRPPHCWASPSVRHASAECELSWPLSSTALGRQLEWGCGDGQPRGSAATSSLAFLSGDSHLDPSLKTTLINLFLIYTFILSLRFL